MLGLALNFDKGSYSASDREVDSLSVDFSSVYYKFYLKLSPNMLP